MSYYNTQFKYRGKTNTDYDLIIVALDNGDKGEVESFLGMEDTHSSNYDGTMWYDYGAKYDSTVTLTITMIKKNYSDFSIYDFRNVARWLTGSKMASWLDVQEQFHSEINYSFLCKCIDLQQYKLDGRVIGVVAKFKATSPWAFSPLQCLQIVNGKQTVITGTEINPFKFIINNHSDDIYSFLYPNIFITNENTSHEGISLTNISMPSTEIVGDNKLILSNLNPNESILIHDNQMIQTNIEHNTIGSRFNWIWPKMVAGNNTFEFIGTGKIIFAYRYPIKVGEGMIGYDYTDHISAGTNCKTITVEELQSALRSVDNSITI
ncbi:MAG: hypothetical protein KBT27_12010 [Prevotellaceae bacterium]|nr:hypothetical protein [Candidatus Faecinaster equi]